MHKNTRFYMNIHYMLNTWASFTASIVSQLEAKFYWIYLQIRVKYAMEPVHCTDDTVMSLERSILNCKGIERTQETHRRRIFYCYYSLLHFFVVEIIIMSWNKEACVKSLSKILSFCVPPNTLPWCHNRY